MAEEKTARKWFEGGYVSDSDIKKWTDVVRVKQNESDSYQRALDGYYVPAKTLYELYEEYRQTKIQLDAANSLLGQIASFQKTKQPKKVGP